jgi:2-dehydro-3-deoxyphosphogluconate aldolase/(4S)-4-hydroxy-2-oxoglutarate aldolase
MSLALDADDPFRLIGEIGIVPVIAINDARHALPLADALLAGGLPVAEVTFRTRAAADVIATLRAERPQMLIGAGTVLDAASLAAAHERGARFALAPGFDRAIVLEAARVGLAFAPGVMTPSELGGALGAGSRVCKFFPGGAAGGPAALQAVAAPFAHLSPRFMPTGGVTSENVASWFAVACVLAVGGTWIATTADIEGERWDVIARNARDAVRCVKDARRAVSTV